AIKKYEAVLAENPDDVLALYELAYSLTAKGDYQKALDVASRGAEYKSDRLQEFYMLVGTDLDMLGKPDEAIKAYKAGIKLVPPDPMLHFNLGITYARQKQSAEARKSLKTAVALKPDYASAHYALAVLFYDDGYRVPALLAAARFLTLEPDSKRAA